MGRLIFFRNLAVLCWERIKGTVFYFFFEDDHFQLFLIAVVLLLGISFIIRCLKRGDKDHRGGPKPGTGHLPHGKEPLWWRIIRRLRFAFK